MCLPFVEIFSQPSDTLWLYFAMQKNVFQKFTFSIVFTNFKKVDTFNPPPLDIRVKNTPSELRLRTVDKTVFSTVHLFGIFTSWHVMHTNIG